MSKRKQNAICSVGLLLGRVTAGLKSLTIQAVENDETGELGFEAHWDDDGITGYGATATEALVDLWDQVQG